MDSFQLAAKNITTDDHREGCEYAVFLEVQNRDALSELTKTDRSHIPTLWMIDYTIELSAWSSLSMDLNDLFGNGSNNFSPQKADNTKNASMNLQDKTSEDGNVSAHESDDKDKSKRKKDFPWKLHVMLEDSVKEGNEHIVSWNPDGQSFQVRDPEAFLKRIMPRYFNQTQFRSFQRMLNLYNFQKIVGGSFAGSYQHPQFQRGDKDLSLDMRIRPRATAKSSASAPNLQATHLQQQVPTIQRSSFQMLTQHNNSSMSTSSSQWAFGIAGLDPDTNQSSMGNIFGSTMIDCNNFVSNTDVPMSPTSTRPQLPRSSSVNALLLDKKPFLELDQMVGDFESESNNQWGFSEDQNFMQQPQTGSPSIGSTIGTAAFPQVMSNMGGSHQTSPRTEPTAGRIAFNNSDIANTSPKGFQFPLMESLEPTPFAPDKSPSPSFSS
eukprot:Nitzschia sp. Nitz4//scaffold30_size153850//20450//21832//NITZ4_002761-RA/size153850-processed-gene-0.173-mRNA-1//1//CDS//3329547211//9252//frame0